jgi:hypothetical protein
MQLEPCVVEPAMRHVPHAASAHAGAGTSARCWKNHAAEGRGPPAAQASSWALPAQLGWVLPQIATPWGVS